MTPMQQIKEKHRQMVLKIRYFKSYRKPFSPEELNEIPAPLQSRVYLPHQIAEMEARHLGYEYRCSHIAYCELRGRTRDQIEPKIKDAGSYMARSREKRIAEYKATYQQLWDDYNAAKAAADAA